MRCRRPVGGEGPTLLLYKENSILLGCKRAENTSARRVLGGKQTFRDRRIDSGVRTLPNWSPLSDTLPRKALVTSVSAYRRRDLVDGSCAVTEH
jgi:hypothetical protein